MMKIGAIVLAIVLVWMVANSDAAASKRFRRQAAETAVATTGSSSTNAIAALSQLILPTFRALVQAPVKVLQELLAEIRQFMQTHNFSEMFDTTLLRGVLQRLPERAGRYWRSFLELESECIQRTLCDVADFTTHQVPQWVRQILLVYFTTFNENIYFEAINNGLIAHNCQAKFTQCDPNSFLSKMANNVSDSIHTTVGPIKEALNDLVNVTVFTLLANDDAVTRAPIPINNEIEDDLNLINGDIDDRLKPTEADVQAQPNVTEEEPAQPTVEQPTPVMLNQNSFLPQQFDGNQFQGMQPFPVMFQGAPPESAPMMLFANPSQLQLRSAATSSNQHQSVPLYHSAHLRQSSPPSHHQEEPLIES